MQNTREHSTIRLTTPVDDAIIEDIRQQKSQSPRWPQCEAFLKGDGNLTKETVALLNELYAYSSDENRSKRGTLLAALSNSVADENKEGFAMMFAVAECQKTQTAFRGTSLAKDIIKTFIKQNCGMKEIETPDEEHRVKKELSTFMKNTAHAYPEIASTIQTITNIPENKKQADPLGTSFGFSYEITMLNHIKRVTDMLNTLTKEENPAQKKINKIWSASMFFKAKHDTTLDREAREKEKQHKINALTTIIDLLQAVDVKPANWKERLTDAVTDLYKTSYHIGDVALKQRIETTLRDLVRPDVLLQNIPQNPLNPTTLRH
ncbi:MAG: hypothetical protein ACD_45C00341G0002 [uncultured bacterium]|nr:MAG: hypothetical protein ACD_45C00341G0002 [uncultured bacterium]